MHLRQKMITNQTIRRIITWLIIASIGYALFFLLSARITTLLLLFCLLEILVVEWPRLCTRWYITALTPLYIIAPFIIMMYMNEIPVLREWLFLLLMSVCANDTGAYLIGSLLGKHTLAPRISPNKTWEGLIGGYCATFIVIISFQSITTFSYLTNVIFALAITISATLGDLFESWFKRNAGIKDSGHLLPGHGGLLDRFDSIIGSLPTIILFYLKFSST
jgi:phosphatidate cytidylyltransferase